MLSKEQIKLFEKKGGKKVNSIIMIPKMMQYF